MQSLRISAAKDTGKSKLDNLLLPLIRVDNDHAAVELDESKLPLIVVEGCRFRRTVGEQVQAREPSDHRHMVWLVSGQNG